MKWSDGKDLDRQFFGMLREEWLSEGTMTTEEIRVISNRMVDLDVKCEQLAKVLREEIVPSTERKDYRSLVPALIRYELLLWEIQELGYIKKLRKFLPTAIRRLSDKYDPDGNDADPDE